MSRTADRPTRPTFTRQEPDEAMPEEDRDDLFADNLMAANKEWELIPLAVRE